jgi:lipopolysaccharide/colanic/teichoic acid biosynthesis glycosyltransferase
VNAADGMEKMKNDVYYTKNCSFALDIKIFFKTVVVVLKKENTYKDTAEEKDTIKEVEELKK